MTSRSLLDFSKPIAQTLNIATPKELWTEGVATSENGIVLGGIT